MVLENRQLTANDFDRSWSFDSQGHSMAGNSLDDHYDSATNNQMLSNFPTEDEHDSLPELRLSPFTSMRGAVPNQTSNHNPLDFRKGL
jgi:hypothetical protein